MNYFITTAGIAKKNNKYFIALRKAGENLGEVWEFPGGKVDFGETPEEALKREYKEEFNVNIEVNEELFETEFSTKSKNYKLKVFNILILNENNIKLNEHLDYKWETLKNLKHISMADSDKAVLDLLIKI